MEVPWKVVGAFLGVFAAGAVFGGALTFRAGGKRWRQAPVEPAPVVVSPSPAPSTTKEKEPGRGQPVQAWNVNVAQMRQWTQRLNLTTEQQKELRPIIVRANKEFARLRDETTHAQKQMFDEVAAILTPEQRAELELIKQRVQEKMEADRKKRLEAQQAEAAARKKGPQS